MNINNKHNNIILVGMTCSGKTSVGRCISELTHYGFLDTDEVIVREQSMSINDIFISKGEESFRRMEHDLVHKLTKYEKYIIATGGGLPIFYDNMDILNKIGITVFLNVDVELIIKRAEKLTNRPLLINNHRETLLKMKSERAAFYKKADIIINEFNEDIWALSSKIIKNIQDYLNNK